LGGEKKEEGVYTALRKPTILFRGKYCIVAALAVWYTHKTMYGRKRM
jgi:hypothetical protein